MVYLNTHDCLDTHTDVEKLFKSTSWHTLYDLKLLLCPVFSNFNPAQLVTCVNIWESRPQQLFPQLLVLQGKSPENPLDLQQNLLAQHLCMIMSSPDWQMREKCGVACILYLVVTLCCSDTRTIIIIRILYTCDQWYNSCKILYAVLSQQLQYLSSSNWALHVIFG